MTVNDACQQLGVNTRQMHYLLKDEGVAAGNRTSGGMLKPDAAAAVDRIMARRESVQSVEEPPAIVAPEPVAEPVPVVHEDSPEFLACLQLREEIRQLREQQEMAVMFLGKVEEALWYLQAQIDAQSVPVPVRASWGDSVRSAVRGWLSAWGDEQRVEAIG